MARCAEAEGGEHGSDGRTFSIWWSITLISPFRLQGVSRYLALAATTDSVLKQFKLWETLQGKSVGLINLAWVPDPSKLFTLVTILYARWRVNEI